LGSWIRRRRRVAGAVIVLGVVSAVAVLFRVDGQLAGSAGPTAGPSSAPARDASAAPGSRRPRPLTYTFPVRGCRADYAPAHHDYPAADIFARRGCAFVAPVDGRVLEVSRRDRWHSVASPGATRGGRSVALLGVDGVRYYGSHLESVPSRVRPGVEVRAGDLLGRVGDSGDARGVGTHLHFGISWPTAAGRWWVRRGAVAPQPFLDSWRSGGSLSPVRAVRVAHERVGSDGHCSRDC
jgi:murein DD-endopeptidase MepM/ murein hydrolase activator NlpD